MINLRKKYALIVFSFLLGVASVITASGQSASERGTAAAPNGNPQVVDARQSGAWIVGIEPTRNSVRVTNSEADPVAVRVIGNGGTRKPFQFRILTFPNSTAIQAQTVAIPTGKRLVIENVSAIARCPDPLKMEINFTTYLDNGDGVGNLDDITFHRIALTDQGVFDSLFIASANHKVLVFADERIGTSHFGLTLQARLSGSVPVGTSAQAQVTFSGYIEDLPVN